MASELKVMDLTGGRKTDHPLKYAFLPNPAACFRMIIFSPSNSGKSNLIKNFITRPEYGYYQFYKKNVFLFSQTLHLDRIWKSLNLPTNHTFEDWDDSVVVNLLNYSIKQPKGILIILDDMITSRKAMNKKEDNLLKKLFYQGRH